jgi:hypothetical protein
LLLRAVAVAEGLAAVAAVVVCGPALSRFLLQRTVLLSGRAALALAAQRFVATKVVILLFLGLPLLAAAVVVLSVIQLLEMVALEAPVAEAGLMNLGAKALQWAVVAQAAKETTAVLVNT